MSARSAAQPLTKGAGDLAHRPEDRGEANDRVANGWMRLADVGAEKQRNCIARAIGQEPRLLLLVEPTNHLHPWQCASYRCATSRTSTLERG